MQFLRRIDPQALSRTCVFGLLAFSVLWKGGKSLETTWLLLGIAVLITLLVYSKRRRRTGKEVSLLLWSSVMLLILWTAVSYLQSSVQNYGLDEVLRTAALGFLFLWVLRLDTREQSTIADQTIRLVGAVTLAACAMGLLVYIFQPVDRFVGTFFDHRFHTDYWPNAWAEYLLLTWPLVYYWSFRTWSFKQLNTITVVEVLCRAFGIGVVIGCFMLSYSRGGLIVFGLQLLLWFLLYYLGAKDQFPRKKIAVLVLIIGIIASIVFVGANSLRRDLYDIQSVSQKVTLTSAEGASSVTERVQFWAQAATLAKERPLFGWGPYSFRFVQPRMQTDVLATSDHPHNVFLKLAAERGLIAMFLFAVIVGSVLLRGIKTELSRRKTKMDHSSFEVVLLVSLTGVLVHNLIDYNLQFVGIAFLFWLLLGLLAARASAQGKMAPVLLAKRTEITLSILLLLTAFLEGGYLVVSSIGRHAEARGDSPTALQWYERAKGEWFSRDLHLSRAKLLYEDGQLRKAHSAVEDYFVQNLEDARAWKRLGDIAFQGGDYDAAYEAYRQAYDQGRYNDMSITQGLLETMLIQNNYQEINARHPEFENLLQRFGNAIVFNTHFIALSPNVEAFIDLAERFAQLYPDNAPLYQVLAARADHNSTLERERIDARPPGFLW